MRALLVALATSASVCVPSLAPAQSSRNVTLLSRFDPTSSYNDIWGYCSPTGKEYAILGASSGIYIVDCTDPTSPVQRRFFSSTSAFARDIKTYRHYIYAVSEGSGGVQIIDMSSPDSPRLVKTWGQSRWSSAHNLALDTETGTLYPCGTDNGMLIIDISNDPENPVYIGSYTSNYVHDLHIRSGTAHLCEVFSSRYRTFDVSNLPSTNSLGTASVSVCHNSWTTRDNRYAVTTSETSGGRLTVFDVSNKRLPVQIGSWRTRASSTIHNAYIRDRVAHMSYYSDGYRAVDLSDPTQPTEVAFYDTTNAWGCYAFQPSGVVYISDISRGMYVLDSKATTELYGDATPAGSNPAPEIHAFGAAFAGNSRFKLELEGAAPSTAATLLLGVAPADIALGGLKVLVDPSQPLLVVATATDANGKAVIPLPLDVGTPAATLYAQFVAVNGVGPLGLEASQGLKFETF